MAKYKCVNGGFGCGYSGDICPACREDRADARTDRIVEGLALAWLLANYENREDCPLWVIERARNWASALREREGGEE